MVAGLLIAIGLEGFIILVAGTTRQYDVVALLILPVFLPLVLVIFRRRERVRDRLALLTHAVMVWSFPFLIGFGVIAFVGTPSRWSRT